MLCEVEIGVANSYLRLQCGKINYVFNGYGKQKKHFSVNDAFNVVNEVKRPYDSHITAKYYYTFCVCVLS